MPKRRFLKASTIVASLAALAMIAAPAAQAAPPTNDQAPGAELMAGTSFPVLSSIVNITEATFTNDPITSCTADDDHGVWFKITPNLSGNYRVWAAAEGPTATTVNDTVLGVFTTPDFVDYTEIACDDDSATTEPAQSVLTTSLTGGTQYYIYVSQFGFGNPVVAPDHEVQVKVDRLALANPPANDQPAGAELLPGTSFPVSSAIYDIADATTTGDPPAASCPLGPATPSRSVWFKVTPNQTGNYRLWAAAEGPTATTVDDTLMAIYTSGGGAAGPFTEVPTVAPFDGCDDDDAAVEDLQSVITTRLNAATEYWIVVWKWSTPAPTAGNSSVQLKVDRLSVIVDTDGDGVPDGSDACPTQPAATANGCPVTPPVTPPAADKTPPETTITKSPANKSTKKKAKYQFESSEANSKFACKIDKGPFKPCTSPTKFKVAPGKHSFQVAATDAAGNLDPTPAKDKFKVVAP